MDEKEIMEIRSAQFPQLEGSIYLSHCRIGVPPAVAVRAVKEFADGQCLREGEAIVNCHEQACLQEAAKLINAEAAEVGLLRSTSEGIGAFSFMLDFKAGDSVVLNDLEFMSNVIPWKIMAREKGIALEIVQHRDGRILTSDIESRIDHRTRAIVISSVQEVNGFRCDLDEIGAIARREGACFIVDAIQHLGALRFDVRKSGIDILIAGGHKWLLSPFGVGIYFVRKELIPRMRPPYIGWKNVDEEDWNDFGEPGFTPIRRYRIRNDSAQKFMISTTDIVPGIPALWRSLQFIHEVGIQNIEERILSLTALLIDELSGRADIVSPLEERHRSGIVTVRTPNDRAITERLAQERIYVSRTYASGTGGIRIAPHFFNTTDEIMTFVMKFRPML